MRRCVACASGDRHLSFELMLLFVFDWLVLLFESVRRNGICGLSVVRVKISTKNKVNMRDYDPWYIPYGYEMDDWVVCLLKS